MSHLIANALGVAWLVYQLRLVNRYMPSIMREAEKLRRSLELGVPVTHLYSKESQLQWARIDAWKESLFANGRDFRDPALRAAYHGLDDISEDARRLFP